VIVLTDPGILQYHQRRSFAGYGILRETASASVTSRRRLRNPKQLCGSNPVEYLHLPRVTSRQTSCGASWKHQITVTAEQTHLVQYITQGIINCLDRNDISVPSEAADDVVQLALLREYISTDLALFQMIGQQTQSAGDIALTRQFHRSRIEDLTLGLPLRLSSWR
jgi:hypothetical protein